MSEPRPALSSSWKERKEKHVPHYDDGHYILVVHGMSLAQNTSVSDQETIRLLVQQVKELQEKVKSLEATQSASVAAAAAQPATVQQEPAEQSSESNQSPTAPPLLHESHGIQWRGLGEVNYKVLDERQPELSTFGFVPHRRFASGKRRGQWQSHEPGSFCAS